MDKQLGYETGEVCNRNADCPGIIKEKERQGSCSCHINPPCSYCVDDYHYCSLCGWDGREEQQNYRSPITTSSIYDYKIRTLKDLDNTKIDYIIRSHTHFTMIVEGVCPLGTTANEVRKVINGTFGGRFEHFGGGKFKFIAYTD